MALLLAALAMAAGPAARLPDWMQGCWEQRSAERWTEECWSSARGNMMIGYSRSGEGGVLGEWEVMQIELVESDDPVIVPLTFSASPGGKGRTSFDWDRRPGPGIGFVNLGNDYPQRIRYWREGRELVAEISLGDGTKARRWRYGPQASRPAFPPPIPPAPSVRGR